MGNTARITEALEGGVPIDDADADGVTALMAAAEASQPRAVRMLLQQNAQLNLVDRDGWSATVRLTQTLCAVSQPPLGSHRKLSCPLDVVADVCCKSKQCTLCHVTGECTC